MFSMNYGRAQVSLLREQFVRLTEVINSNTTQVCVSIPSAC